MCLVENIKKKGGGGRFVEGTDNFRIDPIKRHNEFSSHEVHMRNYQIKQCSASDRSRTSTYTGDIDNQSQDEKITAFADENFEIGKNEFLSSDMVETGFCPEIKSIGTNGPLSSKKVGHFRKYGALVNFPYMKPMAYEHVDKLKKLKNC